MAGIILLFSATEDISSSLFVQKVAKKYILLNDAFHFCAKF